MGRNAGHSPKTGRKRWRPVRVLATAALAAASNKVANLVRAVGRLSDVNWQESKCGQKVRKTRLVNAETLCQQTDRKSEKVSDPVIEIVCKFGCISGCGKSA